MEGNQWRVFNGRKLPIYKPPSCATTKKLEAARILPFAVVSLRYLWSCNFESAGLDVSRKNLVSGKHFSSLRTAVSVENMEVQKTYNIKWVSSSVWNSAGYCDMGNIHKANKKHSLSQNHLLSIINEKTFSKTRIEHMIDNQKEIGMCNTIILARDGIQRATTNHGTLSMKMRQQTTAEALYKIVVQLIHNFRYSYLDILQTKIHDIGYSINKMKELKEILQNKREEYMMKPLTPKQIVKRQLWNVFEFSSLRSQLVVTFISEDMHHKGHIVEVVKTVIKNYLKQSHTFYDLVIDDFAKEG
ncbi:hypothetical protein L9F63_013925, partial [Diploptera punctata]